MGDPNLVTFTITKKMLIPVCSVVSAIFAVVFLFFDQGLFVMIFSPVAIILGHLTLPRMALSAEKLAGALALAGLIVGYSSLTIFVSFIGFARIMSH